MGKKLEKILICLWKKFFKMAPDYSQTLEDKEKCEQRTQALIGQYYNKENQRASNTKRMLIFMADGKIPHAGLSDRLRAITTFYGICKDLDIDFRIHFTSPFPLERILIPNQYDWRISEDQISYHEDDATPMNFMGAFSPKHWPTRYQFLSDLVQRDSHKQIHLYSQEYISYLNGTFSDLFNELFLISDEIKEDMRPHLEELGPDYICVSTRFCSRLGDFIDCWEPALPEDERESLINDCLAAIEAIHQEHPHKKILVTSDSITFSKAVRRLEFAYSKCDEKVNIGSKDAGSDFNILKNAVTDFLLISKASQVIQIKNNLMYDGAFSHGASRINKRPYELREI